MTMRPVSARPRMLLTAGAALCGSLILGLGGRHTGARAAQAWSSAGHATLSAAGACAPRWHIVPSPGAGTSLLNGVAVASPRDVWTVGSSGLGSTGQPLSEHWDGSAWHTVTVPAPAGNTGASFDPNAPGTSLDAVAAPSPHDVWAVGERAAGTTTYPLIAHWNGKRWQLVKGAKTGPGSALHAVAAVSARDVWAAGQAHGGRTLIEHWDGRAWRIVASPSMQGHDTGLAGIVALSATNVWSVGAAGSVADSSRRALVEHWDGTRWRVVPSAQPGVVDDALTGVSASSPTNVWAVGVSEGNDYQDTPLVERWTGRGWHTVPSPPLPPQDRSQGLAGVVAISPDDVWTLTGSSFAHWNGRHWDSTTLHFTPYRGGNSYTAATTGGFTAVTAASAHDLWAVGELVENTDQTHAALIARYSAATVGGACA